MSPVIAQQRTRDARQNALQRSTQEKRSQFCEHQGNKAPQRDTHAAAAAADKFERRWKLELAEVFRQYVALYRKEHARELKRNKQQDRALREIELCRTAALGGHKVRCDKCGHKDYHFNSCRNRNCPKCTGPKRKKWYNDRLAEMLPVEYHHIVFTLPWQLADLTDDNDTTIYDILFRSAADALLHVGKHWSKLGAQLGFSVVLHTWNCFVGRHPHVHVLMPAGGLSFDGTHWVSLPPGFCLPKEWLRDEFRKRFLKRLEKAYKKGELVLRGRCGHLVNPRAFETLVKKMKTAYWHTYAKPVKGLRDGMSTREAARATLAYLARYVRGVAIGNDRLDRIENGEVYFWYKDRRKGEKWRLTSLPVLEFIRRFLFHVLPTGKRHVRNYGFLSPNRRTECLKILRRLFDGCLHVEEPDEVKSAEEPRKEEEDEPHRRCPCCSEGVMLVIQRMDRPSVQDIMLMATHQMRQPKLPFL